VFKPDPDAVLGAVAEVAASVEDEPGHPGLLENRRDDVDEVALAGRSDINHERTPRNEGRAIPDDVRRPRSALPERVRRRGPPQGRA
jgi:hypothetical protein